MGMGRVLGCGLAAKLTCSLMLCSLIVLAAVGACVKNVSKSTESLVLVNRVSQAETKGSGIESSFVDQNRQLYQLLAFALIDKSTAEKEQIELSVRRQLALTDAALASYLHTRIVDSDRATENLYTKDWPNYRASVDLFFDSVDKNDIESAKNLLSTDLHEKFFNVLESLKNARTADRAFFLNKVELADKKISGTSRLLIILGIMALMVAALMSMLHVRSITQPLKTLIEAVRRIESGDLTQPLNSKRNDEIGQLFNALDAMRTSLKDSVEKITSTSEQIIAVANHVSGGIQRLQRTSRKSPERL